MKPVADRFYFHLNSLILRAKADGLALNDIIKELEMALRLVQAHRASEREADQ